MFTFLILSASIGHYSQNAKRTFHASSCVETKMRSYVLLWESNERKSKVRRWPNILTVNSQPDLLRVVNEHPYAVHQYWRWQNLLILCSRFRRSSWQKTLPEGEEWCDAHWWCNLQVYLLKDRAALAYFKTIDSMQWFRRNRSQLYRRRKHFYGLAESMGDRGRIKTPCAKIKLVAIGQLRRARPPHFRRMCWCTCVVRVWLSTHYFECICVSAYDRLSTSPLSRLQHFK